MQVSKNPVSHRTDPLKLKSCLEPVSSFKKKIQ